jgi:hypothetical protein
MGSRVSKPYLPVFLGILIWSLLSYIEIVSAKTINSEVKLINYIGLTKSVGKNDRFELK